MMTKPRYDKTLFIALGKAVNNRRAQLMLSTADLAEQSSLHENYILDVEGGLRNVTLSTLSKVCKALGCTVSELFREAEALMDLEEKQTPRCR